MKLLILTRKFETPRWFKPSHFLLANLIRFVKFMYSKRATKLDKIHKCYMKLLTSSIVKKRLEISLYYHPYMICRQISTEVCMPILKFKYWMDLGTKHIKTYLKSYFFFFFLASNHSPFIYGDCEKDFKKHFILAPYQNLGRLVQLCFQKFWIGRSL